MKKIYKNKNINLDDLAVIIKAGFDGVDKKFESVDKKFEHIGERLKNLESGQEEIKLRLSNVAYRFELQEMQNYLLVLQKRVTALERKKK